MKEYAEVEEFGIAFGFWNNILCHDILNFECWNLNSDILMPWFVWYGLFFIVSLHLIIEILETNIYMAVYGSDRGYNFFKVFLTIFFILLSQHNTNLKLVVWLNWLLN